MANQTGEAVITNESPAPRQHKRGLTAVGIVAGIMLAEAAGVFFIARYFAGGPASANAAAPAGLDAHEGVKAPKDVELEVVTVRAQNEKSQQMLVYDITVAAVFESKPAPAPAADKHGETPVAAPKEGAEAARIAELLARKKATLQDRFGRVVRAMDPQRFSEPDLCTLREQFQYELSQIVGEEATVREVLIPSIVRYNEN